MTTTANPDPAATTADNTQPNPQAPQGTALDANAIAAMTATIVEQVRNATFASLRKAGVLGEEKQSKSKSESKESNAGNAPAVDTMKFRELERAVGNTGHKPTPSQWSRLDRAFATEAPDDVTTWVGEYFAGFGTAAQTAQTANQSQTTVTPPQPNNQHPASDRGAAPAPKIALEDQDLGRMSSVDREALRKLKGDAYNALVRNYMTGRKFVLPRK